MRHLLPILVVVFATLGVATSGAVAVLILASGSCRLATEPITVRLIYQVDTSRSEAEAVSTEQVISVLDRRLNRNSWLKSARIEQLPGGLIAVGVFGYEPAAAERIDRLARALGKIEFRPLANPSLHGPLIDQAAAPGDEVRDGRGKLIGRWAEIAAEAESAAYTEGVQQRTVTRDDRDVVQVLVVEEAGSIDGSSIVRATAAVDENGNPCVTLLLSAEGGRAMRGLTASLAGAPWMASVVPRLGILLDGKIISAPIIQNELGETVQIVGRFSESEASELAETLDSGMMPARLRLIERRAEP